MVTLHPVLTGFLTAVVSLSVAYSGEITLAWNPNPDPSVVGSNLYYGGTSGVYTNVINAGANSSATVSNLIVGVTYYFAATSYDDIGDESGFSSEIACTVPTPPTNSPPTLNPFANLNISQNVGTQTVLLTAGSSGAGNPIPGFSVTVTSSNPNLVPTPTFYNTQSNNILGYLAFTPVANASGSSTVTVTTSFDDVANTVVSQSFVVTVVPLTLQINPAAGGQVNLTVNAPVGSSCVVLASYDLVNWAPMLWLTIPSTGSVDIVDPDSSLAQKFYQVALYP